MKRPPQNVASDLASIQFGAKQNNALPKLPQNYTIHRRPMNHAPVASPFAGADVQKVVYVSRRTPLMSAVKRVKKFLEQIEKRALQGAGLGVGTDVGRDLERQLGEVSNRLAKDREEVLVRASGRAMEQALRVGQWFRVREGEMKTKVEVRGGSVSVVDDLVEGDNDTDESVARDDEVDGEEKAGEGGKRGKGSTVLEEGETTMQLLGNLDADGEGQVTLETVQGREEADATAEQSLEPLSSSKAPRKRRKRKRKEYDADDVPEARIRWVKTVEVAISLRA